MIWSADFIQLSANQLADTVEQLFEQDFEYEQQYHTILNGKSLFLPSNYFDTNVIPRQMGSVSPINSWAVGWLTIKPQKHDGPNSYVHISKLVIHTNNTDRNLDLGYFYWQQPMTNR